MDWIYFKKYTHVYLWATLKATNENVYTFANVIVKWNVHIIVL